MTKIKQVNILDVLENAGEDVCQGILSSYACPLNKDVEDFLHNKAIPFAKQHIAITFLVFTMDKEQLIFSGYYTLANKFVSISNNLLSKTLQKRISKFSQYDKQLQRYLVSMPLIAQLGKNFASEKTVTALSGTDLLSLACKRVMQAQKLIGANYIKIK